jgi:hypothetical protein
MLWLVYHDIMRKGVRYEKYTFWGEVFTLIAFFLLTRCSIEKFAYVSGKSTSNTLFKATSLMFQQAMIS